MLTILTVIPSELGPDYTHLYRQALLKWNAEGLADTQVILLPQRPLKPAEGEGFEVVETEFERVKGYPVWDLMKAVRKAWPLVKGNYVAFDHPEFIWGPRRLERTIAFLEGYRPILALGNLRRPGDLDRKDAEARDSTMKSASAWLRRHLESGRWDEAAEVFENIQTTHWMWASPAQDPGPNFWLEDVFFADKEWLDTWGFAKWDPEIPFQDVYDLIQVVSRLMMQFGLPILCQRMPQSINRVVHLWHERTWGSFSPQMRDWFLSQPERWEKCAFGDRANWAGLIRKEHLAVNQSRFGPGGTAINYGVQLMAWLCNGGVKEMRNFFEERLDRVLR